MFSGLHKVTDLVDDPGFTDLQQVPGLIQADLFFPLITRGARFTANSLDGQKSFFSLDPHSDRPFGHRRKVALHNAGLLGYEGLEVAFDQKFAFYFL